MGLAVNSVILILFLASLSGLFLVLLSQYEKLYLLRLVDEARGMFMETTPQKLLIIHIAIMSSFFLVGLLLVGRNFFWASVLTAIGFFGPALYFARAKSKRYKKFDDQLVDALITMANSMKAGLTLPQSFKVIAENMVPPISQEFELMLKEHTLGATMGQCMERTLERVKSKYLYLAFTAIEIAQVSGGNLPDVLNKISETIRELSRLEKKIESMTAQGKMQGVVLTLMPAAFALIVYRMDPSMITPLFENVIGYMIITAVIALDAMGAFFIWKIINVEV